MSNMPSRAVKHYDIIVVGAGPAGSMAAKSAAAKGRRVCLLERKPVSGVPVRCGEGIGKKGFTLTLEPREGWIKGLITKSRMVSPSGIVVNVGNVSESWILDRAKMDADLVEDAVKMGADFIPSSPVISARQAENGLYSCECEDGRKDGGAMMEYTAPCLILADGVESRLARGFGWNTALRLGDIETCAFARVKSADIEPDCCIFYTGSVVAPGGYAWIFPRGGGEANVGLGVIGSKCEGGLPKRLLLDFIGRRFPKSKITDLHCGGVPVGKWVRPLVRSGVMLVGDAARQVNAINGAGIAYSLYAGRVAGETAAAAICGDGSVNYKILKGYERQWAKNFGKQQERSFALKEFIVSTDDAFLDKVAKALCSEDAGKINYLRVFMKAFASKPTLLLKAVKLFR